MRHSPKSRDRRRADRGGPTVSAQPDRVDERPETVIARNLIASPHGLAFLTGEIGRHGDSVDPRGESGLPVGRRISDHPATLPVELMLRDHFQDEPWGGFSVSGGLIRSFWCDADTGEEIVTESKQLEHALIDSLDRRECEPAAAYAGLIGKKEEEEAGLTGLAQGFDDPWEQFDLGGLMQVGLVDDHRAVAVEEQGRAAGICLRFGDGAIVDTHELNEAETHDRFWPSAATDFPEDDPWGGEPA